MCHNHQSQSYCRSLTCECIWIFMTPGPWRGGTGGDRLVPWRYNYIILFLYVMSIYLSIYLSVYMLMIFNQIFISISVWIYIYIDKYIYIHICIFNIYIYIYRTCCNIASAWQSIHTPPHDVYVEVHEKTQQLRVMYVWKCMRTHNSIVWHRCGSMWKCMRKYSSVA